MASNNEARTTKPRKAKMMAFNREDDEDSTFDEVSSMADRLGLQGEKRSMYIDDHMRGLGYDPVQSRDSYVRRQEEGGGAEQGFGSRWGFGGRGGSGGSGGTGGGRSRRDEDDRF